MKFSYIAAIALVRLVSASLNARATNAVDHIFENGVSPKPTNTPYDLAKALDPDYALCGYIGGDPRYALTCGAERPCGFNDAQSWFGCCSSYTTTSNQIVPIGCSKALSCVPYSQISSCTGACASNTLVTRCTNSASGFCVSLALSTTQLYSNYICAPSSLPLVVVLGTTTGSGGLPSASGGVFSSPNITSGQFTRVSSSTTSSSSSSSSSSTSSSSRSSSSTAGAAGNAISTAAPLLVLAGGALVALL